MAESNSDTSPRRGPAPRKPREPEHIVRERRRVVDFLIAFDPSPSERCYMSPGPTEAMRRSLPVRDSQSTLGVVRTALERIQDASGPQIGIGPDTPDAPLLCAWAAIDHVMFPRRGDAPSSVLLQIARKEILRARNQDRYATDAYLLGLLASELEGLPQ